jgi:hypothetical protein
MGRFDEWFTEPDIKNRKESESDSTQTEAPAQAEEGTGSITESPSDPSPIFRDLDTLPAVMAGDIDAGDDAIDTGDTDGVENPTDVARLPDELANRKQNLKLNKRYDGHKSFNDQVRGDWQLIIESSPDAFEALLYRPDVGTYGIVDDDTGEESFTELDNNQRTLTYQEPEIVFVLDNPDGRESFHTIDADGEQDGLTDDVLILRIAANDVPVGSILEWNEEMAHGIARRWWYVHRIYGYGTQHVGSLYYCIPARNFDSTNKGVVQ